MTIVLGSRRLAIHALLLTGVAMVVCGVISAATTTGAGASSGSPSPTLTPGPYRSGETISISVGANSLFAPYSRIEILECAAPKGVVPIDDTTCDGNTVPGNSILVAKDGSFSESSYVIYQLPNIALGEQPNNVPVCDAGSECVLYIGQDQNNFTKPKIFSDPFTVELAATSPSTAGGGPTQGGGPGQSSSSSPSSSGTSAGPANGSSPSSGSSGEASSAVELSPVSASSGELAFTGVPSGLGWMIAAGAVLLVAGTLGRVLGRRSI